MAVRQIITEENETLRKISKPVDEITPRVLALLDDMRDTLSKAGGVGLAAVQVGFLKRIFIMDVGVEEDRHEFVEFINPAIVKTEGEQQDVEGCLSVPEKYGETVRPAVVTVRATDREGKTFEYTGEGLFARCLCHEYDHLDGILYTDKVVRMLDPDEIEDMREEKPRRRKHRRR